MTPAAAEAILEPKEMSLPTEEELQDAFALVEGDARFSKFSGMVLNSEKLRSAFTRDIVHAITQAHELNNLRPIQDTIEAWYRTSLFVQEPGFWSAFETIDTEREEMSLDQVKKFLGLL